MQRLTLVFFSLLFGLYTYSQDHDTLYPSEIGVDGYGNAGTFGGTFSIGLKYGLVREQNPQFIFGPAFRIQRTWSKSIVAQASGFNIIGLGAFTHVRFYDVLFVGLEVEVLNSPITYDFVNPPKKWIPTAFIGGGYSQHFNSGWRLNLGVYYDVINNLNSPFRMFYSAKKTVNGQVVLLPVIYRLAAFFPLK
jgi:hypothetical protein